MSFILKALKKLENEKASREPGRVEINSAILAPDRRSLSSSLNSPKRLVIALLIVAVSGTCLYFMKRAPSPVAQQPAKEAQSEPAPRAVPVAATPVHGEKPASASPAPSPAVKAQEEPSRPGRALREKSPEPSLPTESGSDSLHGQEALTGSAPSPLTVNGIALQDDPGQSMAVVNGQIVKRGMTVGGAQVERIFLNRVRFRGNGGLFEVHLAK
jgi:general secretion pathway protein B